MIEMACARLYSGIAKVWVNAVRQETVVGPICTSSRLHSFATGNHEKVEALSTMIEVRWFNA